MHNHTHIATTVLARYRKAGRVRGEADDAFSQIYAFFHTFSTSFAAAVATVKRESVVSLSESGEKW